MVLGANGAGETTATSGTSGTSGTSKIGEDPWVRMVCDADSARQFLEDACAQLARLAATGAFLGAAAETLVALADDLRARCAGLKAETLGLRLLAYRASVSTSVSTDEAHGGQSDA